jgi:hypothetical protein
MASIDPAIGQIIILIGAAVAMLITRITSYYWPDGRTRAEDEELRAALRLARRKELHALHERDKRRQKRIEEDDDNDEYWE